MPAVHADWAAKGAVVVPAEKNEYLRRRNTLVVHQVGHEGGDALRLALLGREREQGHDSWRGSGRRIQTAPAERAIWIA
jgi:hypothetical protein